LTSAGGEVGITENCGAYHTRGKLLEKF
jgi:hypothetical protein